VSDDIEKVRREEERRGRRPVDSVTLEERGRLKAALREIVNYGTIEDLEIAMREFGILPIRRSGLRLFRFGTTSANRASDTFQRRKTLFALHLAQPLQLSGENGIDLIDSIFVGPGGV